ncbi:MAG: hypothetical protein RL381_701 [Actinomycetota bacterium]
MLNEALLCLTKNAVYLGAANWADALCHATTRVRDLYSSLEITLLFALNAVSVTLVCLYFCHFCLRSTHVLGAHAYWLKPYSRSRSNRRFHAGNLGMDLGGWKQGTLSRLVAVEIGAGQL